MVTFLFQSGTVGTSGMGDQFCRYTLQRTFKKQPGHETDVDFARQVTGTDRSRYWFDGAGVLIGLSGNFAAR